MLVFEDADVDKAVEWCMFGVFWTCGQICSSTSRLLVHERIAPALFARLKQRAESIKVGEGAGLGGGGGVDGLFGLCLPPPRHPWALGAACGVGGGVGEKSALACRGWRRGRWRGRGGLV